MTFEVHRVHFYRMACHWHCQFKPQCMISLVQVAMVTARSVRSLDTLSLCIWEPSSKPIYWYRLNHPTLDTNTITEVAHENLTYILVPLRQASLDWPQDLAQFQDTLDEITCPIHLPVLLQIMDPHSRPPETNPSDGNNNNNNNNT